MKPIHRSLCWLALLAPLFFLSYGYANQLAASRGVMDSIVFAWERYIPFWDWSIVPYWSIDLLYGLSFLLCKNNHQVDRHALRLLTVQLISVSCFVLFPLHYSFVRPVTDGVFGSMFDMLMGFDQPYNQAPSLHIGILVILWLRFLSLKRWVWLTHLWAALIAISVLTTYQHHFFDVPTGLLAGLLCIWLWPEQGDSPLKLLWQAQRRHWRLASFYALGSGLLLALAVVLKGVFWWLIWPACSLFLVALIYAGVGSAGFQKQHGRFSLASRCLLLPYTIAAWLNSRWWTRHIEAESLITDQVSLGRMPKVTKKTLFDVTAELPSHSYHHLALLDLVVPTVEELRQAACYLDSLPRPVLVSCALGYSRSASVVAAWLLLSKRAASVEQAIEIIRQQRPQIVLSTQHRQVLQALCHE